MSPESPALPPVPPPAPIHLIEAFRDAATSNISDNLGRLVGITNLRLFHRARRLVGTALTVKTRPGDNLAIYKALTLMSPGHVLVVDGGGDVTNALVGELIMRYAQERGCAGFVVDGAVRDTHAFQVADFPCYARAASHRGPYKDGPGEVGVPVSICGQVVHPGDVVVGDEDGIVTFPLARAETLLDAVRATVAKEETVKAEIATRATPQKWIADVLSRHGL